MTDHVIEKLSNSKYSSAIIKQIVNLHMKAFSGFFLTFLGPGFLFHLYSGFCRHTDSEIIVIKTQQDIIVGFAAYTSNLRDLYIYLLKHSIIPLAYYSFCAAIKKPSSIYRLFRSLYRPKEAVRASKYIELSSICVDPNVESSGLGSLMLKTIQENFDITKFDYIKLDTDAENNDAVNRFYMKNGFILHSQHSTPEGRIMNEYRWNNI